MNTAEITNISTRTPYPLDVTNTFADPSGFNTVKDRQVREDRGFYIPDILSGEDYGAFSPEYAAAEDHAKHIHKAECLLDESENLVALMRAAIGDECDARAMQAETALIIIEKKLRKAHSRINKHDRRHTNLFLAYFDLKNKTEDSPE